MAETYAEEIQPVEPSLVRIPAICRMSHGESSFHHAMPSATDFLFLLIVPMLYHGRTYICHRKATKELYISDI